MLDPVMRRVIDPVVDPLGVWLARAGVSANAVTAAGFAAGMGAAAALAFQLSGLALGLLLVNRALDGLDGPVARHGAPSDFGGYADIVADFLVYSGIVLGFAIGRPEHALPAAVLIYSFVGSGTAFLAYGIFAAKRGLTGEARGRKSFFHVGGLTEGTETFLALAAICLFPGAFPWIAYGFAALCGVTTVARIREAWFVFRD